MSLPKIASNAGWNLVGQIVPILVAIVAVRLLVAGIGVARFGFLSLAWALVGYSSLFDLGISRAMTRLIAVRLAEGRPSSAVHVASVGATVLLLFGCLIGAALWLLAGPLVHRWLGMPPELLGEADDAMRILAVSMPVVLLTTAYRGILEAWQAFRPLNLIRVTMGVLTFAGPLAAMQLDARLPAVVAAVSAMRLLAAWMHWRACRASCARIPLLSGIDRATWRDLVRLGGWMSVSNLVSPLMTSLDRFVIGAIANVESVAYYSTPYDMINRTLMLPYALMAVLFPMLSARSGQREASQAMYLAIVRALAAGMFPVMFSAVLLARPLLTLWLGSAFAGHASLVLQILAIGVYANTLAQAPANLIQGAGNPRLMALLHLCELPLFALALWWGTRRFGIVGTAGCWTLRMIVDAVALYLLAARQAHPLRLGRTWWAAFAVSCGAALVGLAPVGTDAMLAWWAVGLFGFPVLAWHWLLEAADRESLLLLLRRPRGEPA